MIDPFLHRLRQATPHARVTGTLIALNLLVWLANLADGLNPVLPDARELLAWGGNLLPLTQREPWRLVSAMFLHAGIIHLAFNMWALWNVGSISERFYGNTQFALIYLLSGLFGSLASLFFAARTAVSVGASGAIFGITGALLAAILLKRDKLPGPLVASMRSSLFMFVGYSLFLGFTSGVVDNAAHVGGLVSGFLLAWIMAEKFDWAEYRRHAVSRALLAVGAALAAAFTLWQLLPARPAL
ncbi:rhomboid family intramembrane serine protease [Burkholderiaceae bacterium FT117]|uniref:rhomboid family intramembrane serine protease n=1 Tax=Zeimonas sediminis TaxID=2944268 RepID=UPI0023431A5E|nr:rhomboid family intramembrane serine protease [Zeimonas sediminis]MCM5570307.1 rhomboid family intramembrane serine protease [Zeimonas sediminis]